jgi:hypothetical protein
MGRRVSWRLPLLPLVLLLLLMLCILMSSCILVVGWMMTALGKVRRTPELRR